MADFDFLNGTPTAPGVTEFDDWLRKRNDQSAARASTAIAAAKVSTTPEEAAKRKALSGMASTALGTVIPTPLLTDPSMAHAVEDRIAALQNSEVLSKNPKLSDWLADQDNAAIAGDRVPELGFWSQLFNGVARGVSRTQSDLFGAGAAMRGKAGAIAALKDYGKTFTDILNEEKESAAADRAALAGQGDNVLAEFPNGTQWINPDVTDGTEEVDAQVAAAKAMWRWLDAKIIGTTVGDANPEGMIEELEKGTAEDLQQLQASEDWRQQKFPVGRGAAEVSRRLEEIPDDAGFLGSTKALAEIISDRPGDFLGFLAGTAAESGLAIGASAAVTAATRNPTLGRAMLFGTAVPNARASNTLELAAEMGYDLSSPEDARRLAEDPAALDKLISSSGTYATVVSMVDALSAGLGSAMVKSPVGSFVVEAVSQAVAGGGGEILARMASGQKWSWTDAILEGLAEMVTAPLEAGGLSSEVAFRKYRQAKDASDRRSFFRALSKGSAESELRKRSPETYKSAVAALTKDGPVENVYVDAGRMDALFQDNPAQLQAIFDAAPELDYRAYQRAVANGEAFAIPTSVYATAIAGTAVDTKLTDHLRLQPDQMSFAEAQEAMAEAEAEMAQIGARIEELQKMDTMDAVTREEYESLVSQLIVAGHAPAAARADALALAKTAQTMAHRWGITPEEFVRQNLMPTIRAEGATDDGPSPFRIMRMNDLTEALKDPARAVLPEFEAIADELAEQNLTPETATEEDIRLAAVAVADKGGLVSNLDEEFLLTPSGIYRATPGEQMMQTVSLRSGAEDLSQWGHTPGQKIGVRDLALVLEKRQRKLYGKIKRTDFSKKTIQKMANWMADEIEFELQTPGANAEGWYTTKFQAALDVLAKVFPEFDTTKEFDNLGLKGLAKVSSAYEARSLMTMILAVTSNGAKVVDNYRMAVDAYREFRTAGRFAEVKGGRDRAGSINDHLSRIAELVEQYDSVAEVQSFLTESLSVSDMNKDLRAAGLPVISKMPADARVPRAVAIFGPKLGAFYANLTGAEGYLTMDLWWTRTINRYRGDVLPVVSGLKNAVDSKGQPIGLHRFKWLVGQPDLTDAQALKMVVDHAQRYADKGYKDGTEAEKAANTLYKAAFVELQEAPAGAGERSFMIEVAAAARAEVAERTGKWYSIADIQALIWYYEKRLMAEMGAKDSGDISYEEAARRAIGGPGGDVFAQASDVTAAEGAGGAAQGVGPGADPRRLPDLEAASPGPVAGVRRVATSYMLRAGLPVRHQSAYVKVEKTRAAEIARLYDQMPDNPDDPAVRRAYEALAKETIAQFDALQELGFTFEWITGEDPYATPAEAIKDMQENGHLWVFPTDSGFGTLNEASAKNPLLAMSGRIVDGREARINDLFRIVHDVFGHGSEGASFGARGEENAWQAHVRMFSPLAARAMTTETRGQNSWVNFGPYGESNRANPKDTVFADQKVGLLPEWVSEVGQAEDVPEGNVLYQSAPSAFTTWFGDSKVVDENGDPLVVMHGTRFDDPIAEFAPLTHFGTPTAANQRLDQDERWVEGGAWPNAKVYPVYLSIENPLDLGRERTESGDAWETDVDMVEQISSVLTLQSRKRDDMVMADVARRLWDLAGEDLEAFELRERAAELLAELGYDGLVYWNRIEDAGKQSWIALRPEQVKSVFNRGTFDPDHPDILFQSPAAVDDIATPADFEGDLRLSSFRKRGWFIISATQSHFGNWDSAENVAEAQRLRDRLTEAGLAYREVRGRYAGTDDGPSFLVFGNEATYGETLRAAFRQESILTRRGFVYDPATERKPTPIIGLRKGAGLNANEDYQTEMPNGEVFTLDMEWPDPKSDDPRDDLVLRADGKVELTHWSPKERTVIDPRHAGKGKMDGPERHRSGPRKSFYGLNVGKRNTAYTRESPSLGGLKHTVAIEPERLYPWDTDPDGLRAKIKGGLTTVQQIGAYETAIKKAGYAGYFVIDGPLGDAAVVFEALPVESVERDMALYQSDDAFFKSALAEAVKGAKQAQARPKDWIAVLSKMPGVKKAELEWTGVIEWLEGLDPTRQVTRDHLYHWVSTNAVQIEVISGEGRFEEYTTDLPNMDAYEEVLITVPALDDIGPNRGKAFDSLVANAGHFGEPNIVVHARMQYADNGDTLFIDEIQSDLNSFWRKRGGQSNALAPLSQAEQALLDEVDRKIAAEEQAEEARRNIVAALGAALPDAVEVAVGEAKLPFTAHEMRNALWVSSRLIGDLSVSARATMEDAPHARDMFDLMLGLAVVNYVQADALSAVDNFAGQERIDRIASIGLAIREAAGPDFLALIVATHDANEAYKEARSAKLSAQRALPGDLRDRLDGVLPLPMTPFEDESAIQLAMKYLVTMAARNGIKRIAWTPGYLQMRRWQVQEQRAQGMVTGYTVTDRRDWGRGIHLRLANNTPAAFAVDGSGTVIDVGYGFPPDLIRGRNIRDILPAALVERVMRPFPDGETSLVEDNLDLPEVNISDNAGEGYRNVYDRQMKRFLEKWAGKFGAKVEVDNEMLTSRTAADAREADAWLRDRAESDPEVARQLITRVAEDYLLEEAELEVRIAAERSTHDAVDTVLRRIRNSDITTVAVSFGMPAKKDPVWSLTFSDEFRAEASKPQPLFQNRPDGARGVIHLPPEGSDANPAITLFAGRDLSTVLHEGGHWRLWLLQRGAARGDQFSIDALATVNQWIASQAKDIADEAGVLEAQVREFVANGTTGAADVDKAIWVGIHERFARGFEAYMREGKAPSIEMRSVFHRFAAWLMEVYRDAKKLRVNLTDEVRQVFDRMLATDEEIAAAQQLSVSAKQIADTAKAMGLDETAYAELVRLQDEERAEAFGLAMRETMAPILAQRSKELRSLRAGLTKKISEEVNAQRHNRAFEWLANGRWLGVAEVPDDLPADLRMDPERLVDEYGQDMLDALPRGRRPMTVVNGLSADETAGWFGYASGAEMLKDLTTKPRARDEIKQRVQNAMAEHVAAQDPRKEHEQTAALVDALHGDKHGQVVAAELRAINRVSNRKRTITSRQQAARIASDIIARTPVRDAIRSELYSRQERKFAEEAARALAKGDTDAAFEAKRKQLIQHSLYVESRKAAELVGKAERKAAQLKRPGTRKNLAGEYLEAIDDVLYTYDFRKTSAAADRKRGALGAYVQMMVNAGRENELSIPDHVLENTKRVPYKTLTVQRLQGVIDTLSNIEHTARLKKRLLDRRREREMDEVVQDITEAFDKNIKGRNLNRVPTKGERIYDAAREYVNLGSNADTILRRIDGWETGEVYKHLKEGIDRASTEEITARQKAALDMDALFAPYRKAERRRMAVQQVWPGSDQALSKWDLISIALNAGNKDNWERLTSRDNPKAFTPEQARELLSNLDERDWRFVQSVWSYINDEFWPKIVERERRTTGVAPKKVEAQLMVEGLPKMPPGLTGGYYPISYDRRFSGKVVEEKQAEIQAAMQAGRFGKAQTRNGHLKQRAAGAGGRTLELGMHVLFGHVNQVIHDLAFSEEVANAWKIVQEPRVRGLFERAGLLNDLTSLEIWLQDVAAGQITTGGVLSRMARHAKSGFTLSKLAFNMSTVAIQFTGVAQSMAYLGSGWMAKGYSSYVAQGMWPVAQRIKERSVFMAEREKTFQRDMFELINETSATLLSGKRKDVMRLLVQTGFWAMQKVQYYVVDAPVWLAAYEKGRKQGLKDDELVQFADRAVARSQASGLYADRTMVERGSFGQGTRQNEFIRLFTALGSYMFAKFNVAQEIVGRTARDVRDPDRNTVGALLKGTVDMLLIFTVEAILYNMIKGTLPGMGDDDDEESWLWFLATETGLSALSTLPFMRDMGSALQGFEGGGAYGGVMSTVGKAGVQIGEGEIDRQFLRAMNDLIGLAAPGYPSTAIWRLADAEKHRQEGADVSPLNYIMGMPR